MSQQSLNNAQLVHNQAIEKFKENLRFAIYDGAALLSVDELNSATRKVVEETLSFLASQPKSAPGTKD